MSFKVGDKVRTKESSTEALRAFYGPMMPIKGEIRRIAGEMFPYATIKMADGNLVFITLVHLELDEEQNDQ